MGDVFDVEQRALCAVARVASAEKGFGVLLFDRADQTGAGWASAGGIPARRIEAVRELPVDVLWWSNMSEEAFLRGPEQAWRYPNLRHQRFLSIPMSNLSGERDTDAEVTFLSKIFGDVMSTAWHLIAAHRPGRRRDASFTNHTLVDDFRAALTCPGMPEPWASFIKEWEGSNSRPQYVSLLTEAMMQAVAQGPLCASRSRAPGA